MSYVLLGVSPWETGYLISTSIHSQLSQWLEGPFRNWNLQRPMAIRSRVSEVPLSFPVQLTWWKFGKCPALWWCLGTGTPKSTQSLCRLKFLCVIKIGLGKERNWDGIFMCIHCSLIPLVSIFLPQYPQERMHLYANSSVLYWNYSSGLPCLGHILPYLKFYWIAVRTQMGCPGPRWKACNNQVCTNKCTTHWDQRLLFFLNFQKILYFGKRLHYLIDKIIKLRPSTKEFWFSFIVFKNW